MNDLQWTAEEESLLKELTDLAYLREIADLIEELKVQVSRMDSEDKLWDMYNQLQFRKLELEKKYRKTSNRMMLLGKLLAEKRILQNEILGFSPARRQAIKHYASLWTDEEEMETIN
ncbi:MAG: hypothetical protein K9I34_00125 [Bacteroidales bacterium]|nr:hypothetical protein [Bacteroidales bacterium]